MHMSDIVLKCARECSKLADECRDTALSERLRAVALQLCQAVAQDAELED